MFDQFLDRIGDWNPQLMRELKCRLNMSNLAISTTISLLAQAILFIRSDPMNQRGTPYWWLSTCEILDLGIWLSLAISGIYLISKDLDREIRHGTLAIVKFTPTKPLTILLGKILGVPILIYWAVFLTLPLQTIALFQIATIAPNAWVWNLVGINTIALLYFKTILSTIEFSLPAILISPILSAIGWFGLYGINQSLLSRHITGSYANLGIYFTEEWQTILTVMISISIAGYGLLNIIRFCYLQSKPRQDFAPSWISFLCNSGLLFAFLIYLATIPLILLGIMLSIWIVIKIFQRTS
jgi:hypothetical protein